MNDGDKIERQTKKDYIELNGLAIGSGRRGGGRGGGIEGLGDGTERKTSFKLCISVLLFYFAIIPTRLLD